MTKLKEYFDYHGLVNSQMEKLGVEYTVDLKGGKIGSVRGAKYFETCFNQNLSVEEAIRGAGDIIVTKEENEVKKTTPAYARMVANRESFYKLGFAFESGQLENLTRTELELYWEIKNGKLEGLTEDEYRTYLEDRLENNSVDVLVKLNLAYEEI